MINPIANLLFRVAIPGAFYQFAGACIDFHYRSSLSLHLGKLMDRNPAFRSFSSEGHRGCAI
jgi:hypothetical protein